MSEVPHVFIDSGEQSFVCPVCGGYWLGIGHIGCIEKLQSSHDTLQSKLTEMEQCLSWASENVSLARPVYNPHGPPESWECESKGFWCVGPTLYHALYKAWESREVKT